jgi:uncharacterized membrane protein
MRTCRITQEETQNYAKSCAFLDFLPCFCHITTIMNESILDMPVDIKTVRRLHQEGYLTDEAFRASLNVVRPPSVWFAWAERQLLFFGSALLLSGIMFFFAYNWAAMGKFIKLGMLEAGLVACALAAYKLGLNKLTGKVLLLSASVLLGILMAVYGQTYQTGADAYELFVGWAVLIFGWVVISEFAALWFFWLILINTGFILHWIQVVHPVHSPDWEIACLSVGAINGVALVLREIAVKKGFAFLHGKWLGGLLLVAVLTAFTVPAMVVIFDHSYYYYGDTASIGYAVPWPLVAVGAYLCYRRLWPDMLAVALVLMNACLLVLCAIGRFMFNGNRYHYNEEILFLVFALIIIGVVSLTAFGLKKIAATMAKERTP